MNIKYAVVLTLVGTLAACERNDEPDTDPGLLPADQTMTQPQPTDMTLARSDFSATPQAGDLNISGWAEVRQRGATMQDGLELKVHLMGLSDGDHAWHIHRGTCSSPGPIALPISGPNGFAGDLNASSDGMVEETVNIDGDRLAGLNLQGESHIINVHMRGGDNPGPGIACAELNLQGAQGWTTQPGTGTTNPPATTTGY
jgi:hypothetical protein